MDPPCTNALRTGYLSVPRNGPRQGVARNVDGSVFIPAGRRAFWHCARCGEGLPTTLRDSGYLPIRFTCPRKCGHVVELRPTMAFDLSRDPRPSFEWFSPTVDEWGRWLEENQILICEMSRQRLTAFLTEWERWYCGGGLLPRRIVARGVHV